ncbi:ATP-binding cassette domain-containing protein [Streptococcus pluranimalium]|uniref:ATP-binding cassette domain-containing protein n=1 Tax=Streptococcus pluranimalium TaxID=82348 RepID=UPI00292E551B|nr:ATP-binding cassette domain-containing protein [Streptococcus pluranimalium]
MLKLEEITKKYGRKVVLQQINLEFKDQAGVYGLLGRNGVGKTTMMKLINDMIASYDGRVSTSFDLAHIVFVTSDVSDYNSVFQGKITKLIRYYENMYPKFDAHYAEELLARFNLDPKLKIKKLSTGNKTLVYNILGLATRETVTVFDEPTNGLDSVNRQKFFDAMLEDYAQHPRLIILSTHLIQEVENYLTHVIMLKEAALLVDANIEDVQARAVRLTNADLPNKYILHQRQLGSTTETYLFDTITEEDIREVTGQGGQVGYYDLQTLFNYLVED